MTGQFMFQMFRVFREQLQVRWVIVLLVFIPMMHNFSGQEKSPKHLLHYQTMFQHVRNMLSAIRMIVGMNQNVSIFVNQTATFPIVMLLLSSTGREFLRYSVSS